MRTSKYFEDEQEYPDYTDRLDNESDDVMDEYEDIEDSYKGKAGFERIIRTKPKYW